MGWHFGLSFDLVFPLGCSFPFPGQSRALAEAMRENGKNKSVMCGGNGLKVMGGRGG